MPRKLNGKTILLAIILAASSGFTAIAENFIPTTQTIPHVQRSASPNLILRGEFIGQDGYSANGEAFILRTAHGYALVLSQDFSIENDSPAMLGFGKNGQFIEDTRFAVLQQSSGRQTYILPEGFSLTKYSELYVVTEDAFTPLSLAALHS